MIANQIRLSLALEGLLISARAMLPALAFAAQAAQAQDVGTQATRRHYDIPALPLDVAVSRFAEISGVDVLLRQPPGAQRRSSPVTGFLTAAEALVALLQGSGLAARFTSERSAVIMAEGLADAPSAPSSDGGGGVYPLISLDMMHVTAARVIGATRSREDEVFAEHLAAIIRRIVMDGAVLDGGRSSNLRVDTRISADGALYDVRVVMSSNDRKIDARVAALLEGARLGMLPPGGLHQPLLFEVSGR